MRAESGDGLAGDGRIARFPKSDVGPVDAAESGERLEGANRIGVGPAGPDGCGKRGYLGHPRFALVIAALPAFGR